MCVCVVMSENNKLGCDRRLGKKIMKDECAVSATCWVHSNKRNFEK